KTRRPPAWDGDARELQLLRLLLARASGQAAVREVRTAARRRSAGLRHRAEGAVGGESRAPPARARASQRRLAARRRHLRRVFPVPNGGWPGHGWVFCLIPVLVTVAF